MQGFAEHFIPELDSGLFMVNRFVVFSANSGPNKEVKYANRNYSSENSLSILR